MPQHNFASVADRLSIHLLSCQLTTIDSHWNAIHVSDSYWRLYVNDRDGAWVHTSHGDHQLVAGRIHLLPAWMTFTCLNVYPIGHLYMHFDLLGFTSVLIRQLFNEPVMLEMEGPLEAMHKPLLRQLSQGPLHSASQLCQVKSFVYAAVGRMFAQMPPDQLSRCDQMIASQQPVQPAIRMIDEGYAWPLTNRQLAHQCCMSEDYFIRRFRDCLGQTPGRYLQCKRVSEAAKLLTFGNQSIEQIAEATGFSNRFYFSRVFARHFGEGPASYRKRQCV